MSITAKQQTDEGVIGYSSQEEQATSKMHSLRLTESINWRSRNSEHSVGLSAENGFTKIPFIDGQQFQLRVNANWNYRIFTLNSYYQQGDLQSTRHTAMHWKAIVTVLMFRGVEKISLANG